MTSYATLPKLPEGYLWETTVDIDGTTIKIHKGTNVGWPVVGMTIPGTRYTSEEFYRSHIEREATKLLHELEAMLDRQKWIWHMEDETAGNDYDATR